MTKTVANEQNIEKQIQKHMGCMAGFLQLFDRHHIATPKRLYSAKSLPSSPATEMTTSESEKSTPPSPPPSPPAKLIPPKSPVPLTTVLNAGAAKSTWKFGKEAPRLSLDSRAVTDSKGCLHPKAIRTTANTNNVTAATTDEQQHRSPSVIARLMGLEPLPPLSTSTAEPELRRCASDSRAAKDIFYSRFEDFNDNLHGFKDQTSFDADPRIISSHGNNTKQASAAKFQQRKCFFDSGDVFPEPKKMTVGPNHGEIENKLRMRGIMDHPSKDLETLRQILEALQLKGLLHSRNQIERRNFVYDEPPMVLVKSSKPLAYSTPANNRFGSDYSPKSTRSQSRRSYGTSGEISPSISPRRERNGSSPVKTGGRNEGNRRSNSLVKPKPLSVDTQRRRVNEIADNRRVSPVHSPRVNSRRTGPDQTPGNSRSPRCKKPTAEVHRKEKTATTTTYAEDESSSISDCSYSTSTDTERSKSEEYKDGKNLLERCGKLLHSIAEMTSTDMQPSPVSVLDSSFYKDESFTPSPVTTRRNIEFKGEAEYEPWSPVISPIQTKYEELSPQDDNDHAYISDILRAFHYLPENSDIFSWLEKQQYRKGSDTSIVSKLQRKLMFDVIKEIIDRNTQLPPWKAISSSNENDSIDKIWSEFQKLRDRNNPEDLFETICGVLKEDLAGDALNGWRDCYAEMSCSILDIERMIFKDLISDTIRDLAEFSSTFMMVSSPTTSWPRRKLVF